jgi:hypothetical protein
VCAALFADEGNSRIVLAQPPLHRRLRGQVSTGDQIARPFEPHVRGALSRPHHRQRRAHRRDRGDCLGPER